MTIPKWAVALLALVGTLLGLLGGIVMTSIAAGERLGTMSKQIEHLTLAIAPAVVTVSAHEARLVGAETRLNYCCPVVAPRASGPGAGPTTPALGLADVVPHPAYAYRLPLLAAAPIHCFICEPSGTAIGWLEPGVLLATSRSGASVRAGAQREESVGAVSGMAPGAAIASEGAGAHHGARIASTPGTGSTPALATFSTVTTY